MATNQAIDGRWNINVPVPAGVAANQPVLVGVLAGVVLATQPIATPSSPTTATIDLGDDCYFLTVTAATVESPLTGSAIKPGDALYAAGTLDSATNITTGLTIDKNSGGTLFGHALTSLASGTTGLVTVRLKG